MPDSIVVRSASTADIPALTPLVREYWKFEGIDGYDQVRVSGALDRLLGDSALGAVWIAEVGGRPVGYLVACFVFSLEHGGLTGEIDELFLLPGYREAGLGRRLLLAAEAAFREAGCSGIWLEIGRRNAKARKFYEKLGFGAREYRLMEKSLERRRRRG